MSFYYEWDVETEDDNENIDHHFCESAREALQVASQVGGQVVLTWSSGNDMNGVTDRAWAYVKDGRLPEFFSIPSANGDYAPMGQKVPGRFHDELRRALR